MIKKRDNFLFFIPILIASIIIILTGLLVVQLQEFGKTYLEEVKKELNSDTKQALWVIEPLLKNRDFQSINEYCKTFKNERIRITVINNTGEVIAESQTDPKNIENHFNRPEIQNALKRGHSETNIRYSSTMHSEMLYKATPININGNNYIIRVSVSTENICETLKNAERNIYLTFFIGFGGVLLLTLYIFIRVRIPFNKLQQSAVKIASGELNTEIFVPKNGVLWELSRAINVMAKQLKRQIKNMKKMENFRSEFIANVSHEIKTPLTSILSAVEILDGIESKSNIEEKCLRIISNQSKRLNTLIQDILSLADLEKRQIFKNRDFAELTISSTVENAISLCKGIVDSANIELEILENTDIKIFGNSYLLEQAINNLIVNAVKYSQTNKITVKSYIENNEIKISVKDYGIGIAKEECSRIFERFYRVDKARSRELGGTGLGLAIVKNIAKLHNGKVEVFSKLKAGSEFIITIPII